MYTDDPNQEQGPARRPTLAMNPERILRIVDRHQSNGGALIEILDDIQAEYNYLPRYALKLVSARTKLSLVDIYGFVTFFKSFSLEPRGRHLVSVCMGTACHVRGAPRILEEFERSTEIKAGQTRSDQEFTLTTVNCLGACALGPVALVDGRYIRNVNTADVSGVVHQCGRSNDSRVTDDERIFRVNVSCPRCNRSLVTYDHLLDGQPMVHVTAVVGREHGWMRMSSLYGDYRMETEHEIPENTVVNFFCPRCHAELRSTKLCPRCDAPMIPLLIRAGGIIQFCSRRGCKEHLLDLSE